jgi:SAM-dependent methyltransferase
MSGAVEHLARVVEPPAERPKVGNADHPMRRATRSIAFDPGYWTADRAATVADVFDGLAPDWDRRYTGDEMHRPLLDALSRGGALAGPCVEVGAGTGLATPLLLDRFGSVVAVDLAAEMLARFGAPAAARVRADGARLPVRSGSVGVLVLVNAFLFPDEVERIVRPDGAVVWVNTLAEDTPIHLPADDVVAALPGRWEARASEAGWGSWAVARRAR